MSITSLIPRACRETNWAKRSMATTRVGLAAILGARWLKKVRASSSPRARTTATARSPLRIALWNRLTASCSSFTPNSARSAVAADEAAICDDSACFLKNGYHSAALSPAPPICSSCMHESKTLACLSVVSVSSLAARTSAKSCASVVSVWRPRVRTSYQRASGHIGACCPS